MMPFSKTQPVQWALWALVLAPYGFCLTEADQVEDQSPPFPWPFLSNPNGRFRIISEEFDSQGGYATREEFVDMSQGKATFVKLRSGGRETYHMDAATLSSYYYVPYECWAHSFPEKPSKLPQGGWWLNSQWAGPSTSDDNGEYKHHRMYLTGVTAVWMNAKDLPKVYSKASSIYSTSKDVYQVAHKWQATLDNTKATFYFHEVEREHPTQGEVEHSLVLEAIELESKDQKTTINVLGYEFDLEESVFDRELQLPLSYGCYKIGPATEEMSQLKEQVDNSQLDHWLRLEAVATKQADNKRSTDTVSLEFVRSSPAEGKPDLSLQLLRQRSSKMDLKVVLDHVLNVKYEIDMRRGACAISSAGDAFPAEETQMLVKFANGIELKINRRLLDILFFKLEQYRFTKSVQQPNSQNRYVYLTMPASEISDNTRARIVRKYSIRNEGLTVRLDSVTVWVLGAQPTHSQADISEIYHFTLLESQPIDTAEEMAHLFDISEECYLNSDADSNGAQEAMRYGRDFALMELHYTVNQANLLGALPYEIEELKQRFYESMRLYARVGYNRLPRVEVQLDEVGFTLRFLMLDSPPLHFIYDRTEGQVLVPRDGDQRDYFSEIAPDLRHCSELCRLNRCYAFSFCENSFSCVLAVGSGASSTVSSRIVARTGNTLFKTPAKFDLLEYHDSRLHHFIGQLQRHHLGRLDLPPLPDELTVSGTELGISVARVNLLRREYSNTLREYLADKGLNAVSLIGGSLFSVPDRFQVEQDPVGEFALDGKAAASAAADESLDGDDQVAPAFHEGLSQYRFNYHAFQDGHTGDQPVREARRYVGIDYAQCALACLDGRCSSFSFCRQRQDCLITNVWDLQTNASQYLQADTDCVIIQRDFLSKFHKLTNVKQPSEEDAAQSRGISATNPSECAHGCITTNDLNCLSFTYCTRGRRAVSTATCFYSASRSLGAGQIWNEGRKLKPVGDADDNEIRCDHYSRSYLADFTRIEYRELQLDVLDELKTSQIEGKSVDACAELCATELIDCTAFQFCFDPEQAGAESDGARQRCTMIESPPKEQQEDLRIVLGEDGRVLRAGKLFKNNQNCHVFSLRKGSSEAELRQLALNPLNKQERGYADEGYAPKSAGLSLGAGFLLFVCCTLIFSASGIGFALAQRKSITLRSRLDYLRALMGRYY